MEQKRTIAIKVGIFCIMGILILIGFSLRARKEKVVKAGYPLKAYFEEVKGLEEGAPVLLMGVEAGRVTRINFDLTKARVRVDMLLTGEYPLPRDSQAAIYYKSLLGQYYVHIKYGEAKETLIPDDEISTYEVADLNTIIENAGELSKDAREFLSSLDENQRRVTEKITTLIDENRENINNATKSFADLGPKANQVAEDLTKITKDLREGEGMLAKLITDREFYDSLQEMVDGINKISADIRTGKGTISKLLYDEALHKELETTISEIKDAANETKSFLSGQREKISNVVDSAQRAMNQVEQTFKEGEEQGLMRTFVTVLFASLL